MIEKRFEQIKTVHEIAPVFLKNEGRIEAMFTVYFLPLLVQALVEREPRQAMKSGNIDDLPLYRWQRSRERQSTEQILGLYSLVTQQRVLADGLVRAFEAELTDPCKSRS